MAHIDHKYKEPDGRDAPPASCSGNELCPFLVKDLLLFLYFITSKVL